jgi:hypothetical protein
MNHGTHTVWELLVERLNDVNQLDAKVASFEHSHYFERAVSYCSALEGLKNGCVSERLFECAAIDQSLLNQRTPSNQCAKQPLRSYHSAAAN